MGNQEAMNRNIESLRRFSGQPGGFITWSEHFMDHMARVHHAWRPTFSWMSKTKEPRTMQPPRNESMSL